MNPSLPPTTRAWVEIDLPAIDRNVGRIKQALPPRVRYVAVVKANAYGHGMPEVATRLLQAGVDCFAVANVGEAARLREIGHDADILLLSPSLPGEMPRAVGLDLDVTLNSVAEAEALERCAASAGRKVRVHVKVDTGMGRAGVWHERACEVFAQVLASLDAAYPGFSEKLLSDDGSLVRYVNLFVDDDDVRFMEGLDTVVPDGVTVSDRKSVV